MKRSPSGERFCFIGPIRAGNCQGRETKSKFDYSARHSKNAKDTQRVLEQNQFEIIRNKA
jgi:hypothetical protein